MTRNKQMRATLPSSLTAGLALLAACDSQRLTPPPAAPSSPAAATALIHVQAGQPFFPACLIVDSGATVEWRNRSPQDAAVVLSPDEPYELASPSLTAPYNLVPAAASDECDVRVNGSCQDPRAYSFWRHTFVSAGVFDYKSSGGSVSTSVGDGDEVITAPPTSASAATGTVCVRGSGSDCQQVCCTGTVAGECATGVACVLGRCGGVK
jgi:plastocyanin